jgi:hypothetical protein
MALLYGINCVEDGATALDNLQLLLRDPDTSSPNPEYPRCLASTEGHSAAVHAGDMEVFSVAYVSGSIARQVLRGVCCDACKTCLTSAVLLRTSVFIYFKVYSDTKQFLTYPSEKLADTVGAAVTIMESVMAEVAHLNSVEQHITAGIKNSIDFEWIRCTGCSLQKKTN